MKRKITAITLALILTGCVTACGSPSAPSSSDPVSQSSAASQAAPESSAPESAPALPETPVDIEGMVAISNAVMPSPEDNFVDQLIKDRIQVNLTLTTFGSGEDLQTNLNLRLMGGDAPDFFAVSNRTNLSTYVSEGFLLNLGDYAELMPNAFEFMGDCKVSGMIDGEQYAIAKRPYGFRDGLWIRKDWLDKCGLEVPTTLDGYIEAIRTIAASDPDGNGFNDTIGLTGVGLNTLNQFLGSYGVGNHSALVLNEDGTVSSPLYDPAYREALEYCKSLMDEGLIDKEFLANNGNMLTDKFIQGSYASIFAGWPALKKPVVYDPMIENNPEAEWIMLDGLTGPYDNYAGQYDDISNSGLICVSSLIKDDQEKVEAVCRLFDYVSHGEGLDLVQFGIEGEHFIKDAGGNYSMMEDGEALTNFTYVYQFVGRNELPYCQVKFAYAYEEAAFAYNRKRVSTVNSVIQNPEWYKPADVTRYIEEEVTKFIFGNRPFSEYDAFLEVLNNTYEYDRFVQESTDQYQKLING